jgi:putative glycosyltransferase (TIGR04372 family)
MIKTEKLAHATALFQVYREWLRQRGYWWLFTRLIKRTAMSAGWLLLLPITLVLHATGFRRITVITDRIGHLAAEIDCFLKERALGRLPKRHWFVLAPPGRTANRHLIEYWRAHVTIVESPLLCRVLGVMSWWWLMKLDVSHYVVDVSRSAAYYAVSAEWGDRKPVLELWQADRARGWQMLESMGVPSGSWFVCLHAREGGYSPADEFVHAHRNSDVLKLIPAIELITSRGGWCIRMGDPSTKPLPPMDRVVDYAHHPARSDWMDIFLCASCRFFVGNSSGLCLVGVVFGIPCALTNMIPVSTLGCFARDISIPKLLQRRAGGHYLPFKEILNSPLADYRLAKLYRDAGIEVEENSAEDIRDLVAEMLDRLQGTFVETGEDRELQRRYMSLFRPGHYAYAAASRVGAAFLRKYKNLLL